MSQEIKASEIQYNSIDTFGNLVKIVKEHPLGAIFIILGLLFGNLFQWNRGKKEQKRHEKVESRQKDALQKQDAQIRECRDSADENRYLKELNESLCKELAKESDGDESSDEKQEK